MQNPVSLQLERRRLACTIWRLAEWSLPSREEDAGETPTSTGETPALRLAD